MGVITLEGMRFFAYHGYYKEERIIGNDFIVSVNIETDFSNAAEEKDLNKTINYETVYLVCQAVMREKTQLIETLITKIVEGLKKQFNQIESVEVKVEKLNPPLGGITDRATVTMDFSFVDECGRCGRGIICYQDENCWCNLNLINPKTKEITKQQYQGCLCQNCLNFYGIK